VLRFLVRRLGLGALVMVAVSFFSWLVFATALNPVWEFFQTPHAPAVRLAADEARVEADASAASLAAKAAAAAAIQKKQAS